MGNKKNIDINEFIEKRNDICWYVKDRKKLSEDAIVEAVLNYGDWDDVKKIIEILGMKKTASIFEKTASKKRCNYNKKTKNYFKLYFQRHAR